MVEVHGVTIMGHTNLPGALSADASSLYARNLFNFISLIVDKKTGALNIDWNDEIVKGAAVTKDSAVVSAGISHGNDRSRSSSVSPFSCWRSLSAISWSGASRPALHTPLMAVTNAISSVIVVGALIAVAVPVDRR